MDKLREVDRLKNAYELYCEGKREIGEAPLPYEDWLILEKQAQEEWRKS